MIAEGTAAPEAAPLRFVDVAATAAMAGCCLYQLADGGFLLTKPGWLASRELPTLEEAVRLLRQITGGRA